MNCRRAGAHRGSWYQRVLGMEREEYGDQKSRTALKFGGQKINLRPVGEDFDRHAWVTGAQRRARAAATSASSPRSDPQDVVDASA